MNLQRVNADHRMPVFQLAPEERHDLAAFLASLTSRDTSVPKPDTIPPTSTIDGKSLINQLRCNACHRTNQPPGTAVRKTKVTKDSDWDAQLSGQTGS